MPIHRKVGKSSSLCMDVRRVSTTISAISHLGLLESSEQLQLPGAVQSFASIQVQFLPLELHWLMLLLVWQELVALTPLAESTTPKRSVFYTGSRVVHVDRVDELFSGFQFHG